MAAHGISKDPAHINQVTADNLKTKNIFSWSDNEKRLILINTKNICPEVTMKKTLTRNQKFPQSCNKIRSRRYNVFEADLCVAVCYFKWLWTR